MMTSTDSIQKTVAICNYSRALDAHEKAKEFLQITEQEYKDSYIEEKRMRFDAEVFRKRANASNEQLNQFIRSNQNAHQAYCRKLIADFDQSETLVGSEQIDISSYTEIETEHKRLANEFAVKSFQESLANDALRRAMCNHDRVLIEFTQALDNVQNTEFILLEATIALLGVLI